MVRSSIVGHWKAPVSGCFRLITKGDWSCMQCFSVQRMLVTVTLATMLRCSTRCAPLAGMQSG
jgi:hypothetical protein